MEHLSPQDSCNPITECAEGCLVPDAAGKASVMVRIPRFRLCDVIDGAGDAVHPAFCIGGREVDCIYVSKYQNVVKEDRAYSLPGLDPAVLLDYGAAEKYCENKGGNWHLMTNAEWSAVALWSKKNKTLPRGNNDSGAAYDAPEEKGILASLDAPTPEGEQGPPLRVATGSGPASWSHDGTEKGIYDLNGNIWEMVAGVRLVDAKIQILPDNDAALGRTLQREGGWRSVGADGSLVEPGAPGSLCYASSAVDETGAGNGVLATGPILPEGQPPLFAAPFAGLTKTGDVAGTGLLEALCLFPDADNEAGGLFWGLTQGEKLPIRGGYWVNREMAGIFACGFYMERDSKYYDVGFRACYYE